MPGPSLREAVGATLLGTVIPGAGLLRRQRTLGIVVLFCFFGPLLGLVVMALVNLGAIFGVATNPAQLRVVGVALAALGLAWVAVIVGTWLVNRPRQLSLPARVAGAALVGTLSMLVSAPLFVAAGNVQVQADLIDKVFTGGRSQTRTELGRGADPWPGKQRLNFLLLGGDSGSNRSGLRTDTIMVASIDLTTGNTTLVQIPRNMARMPFPEGSELAKAYPDGFYDGHDGNNLEFMANAVWDNVPAAHPELFGNTSYPGADALKMGVQAATGLQLDYFVMVNMQGLQQLIDAMGGVTLNVNRRIPVAGNDEGVPPTGWIEPGPDQKLNGYYAMWYGRSRKGSTDFDRMARQSCVIKAVIDQANPANLLTRYEAIARASGDMVMTDIPQQALQPIVELALRVKQGQVRRVMFVNGKDGFNSSHPDFDAMRERVQAGLDEAAAQPAATSSTPAPSTPNPATSSTPSGSSTTPSEPTSTASSTPAASATPKSESVGDACAYHPEQAEAQPTGPR